MNIPADSLASFENGKINYCEQLRFEYLNIVEGNDEFFGAFDLILSNAVLEHVPAEEVGRAFVNMWKCLAPGGIMLHQVDLRDHMSEAFPFYNLGYSTAVWETLTKDSIFYTNRLRVKDYEEFLGKIGAHERLLFEVETASGKGVGIHKEMTERYQQDELWGTNLVFIVRKPDN